MDKEARKKEGSKVGYFIMFVECRASMLAYRLYFVKNIFEVKKFLFEGKLMINKKILWMPNERIKLFDIIQLTSNVLEKFVKINIIKKLKSGAIYTGIPRYIFYNYALMFGYIYTFPKVNDIAYPKNRLDFYKRWRKTYPGMTFDIYRVCDYL